MCDVLSVSRSGYYASIDREPSPRAQRQPRIHDSVRQAHVESNGIYGSYKIAKMLDQRDDLETACRNTVAKAMREMDLHSRVSRNFTPTTTQPDPSKLPAPNRLDRDFSPDAPNRKRATAIRYLGRPQGWVY